MQKASILDLNLKRYLEPKVHFHHI